jgi:orotidine-5'-phosphate decarboxylase
MTLFYQVGPEIVAELKDLGFKVFLDLKLHDIPHQVECASAVLAGMGVDLITMHAAGGAAMMKAAMRGAHAGAKAAGNAAPKVIAVTVLTSMNDEDLHSIGVADQAASQVERLISLSCDAGTDGVVCSPHEAAIARKLLGGGALIVTPGVRPAGADMQDQNRVMTPHEALCAGSSHLVIGRPITQAEDKRKAFEAIVEELEGT